MDERGAIRIRGHTLLCLQGFRGEGYSATFIENLAAIHRRLAEDPERMVEVVEAPDAVCGACPHRAPSGCSLHGDESEEDMRAQDLHVLALLGLKAGTRVRWSEVLDRIRASVTGDSLPGICGRCRWLPLGYCRDGIEKLRASPRTLIYDDQCRLCVTAKEGLERLGDGPDVRFLPYQSEEAARRLGSDYKPGRPDAAFLVERDGTISRGLDAFLPLLPGLPGGRLVLALMRIPLLRPLGYLAYRLIARYRYRWFGTVPTGNKPRS